MLNKPTQKCCNCPSMIAGSPVYSDDGRGPFCTLYCMLEERMERKGYFGKYTKEKKHDAPMR